MDWEQEKAILTICCLLVVALGALVYIFAGWAGVALMVACAVAVCLGNLLVNRRR